MITDDPVHIAQEIVRDHDGQTSVSGTSGSVRPAGSTCFPDRISAWMSSLTSYTLTFIPATTAPLASQNAMNSRPARSPRYTT